MSDNNIPSPAEFYGKKKPSSTNNIPSPEEFYGTSLKKKGVSQSQLEEASTSSDISDNQGDQPSESLGDGDIYTYNGSTYKKRGNKWYKLSGGKYVPLTDGNVAQRVEILNSKAKKSVDRWANVTEENTNAKPKYRKDDYIDEVQNTDFNRTGDSRAIHEEALQMQREDIAQKEEEKSRNNNLLQNEGVYTGYPGKDGKIYKIIDNHWFEVDAPDPKFETLTQPGGENIYRKIEPKSDIDLYNKDQKWKPIDDQNRLKSLNKYFKKEASLDSMDQVFTNYDDSEEKKDNLYKIDDGEWKRLIPGASEYSTVLDENAINALNSRYNKNIEYKDKSSDKKQDLKLKFVDINSSLTGKTEEEAVRILEDKYGDYGFQFSQEGLFNIDRVRVKAANGKEITVEFDEKNSEEALKLRNFIEQNASNKSKYNLLNVIDKKVSAIGESYNDKYNISRAIPTDNSKTREEKEKYYNSEEYKKIFKSLSIDEMDEEVRRREREYPVTKGNIYNIYKQEKEKKYNLNDKKIKSLYEQLNIAENSGNKQLKKEVKSKIDTYLSDEVIKNQVMDYNIHLNDLVDSGKKLKTDIKQYELLVSDFNKSYASMSTEEVEKQKKILENKAEQLEIRRDNISTSFKNIEGSQKKINILAGEYISSKAKMGSFGGAIVNSFLTGAVKIIEPMVSASSSGYDVAFGVKESISPEEEKYYKDKGYSYEDIQNIKRNERYKSEKDKRREAVIGTIGSETTKEYISSKDNGFFEKALYGVAESAPAMLASLTGSSAASFGALASQSYSSIEDEMLGDEDFKTTTALDRSSIAIPYALLMGVLENYGLKNALKGSSLTSGILKGVISRSLKKMPSGAEKEVLQQIIDKEVKNVIAKGAIKIVNGALAEFETGATQSLVLDIGLKEIYNQYKDKTKNLTGGESFDTPDSFAEGASRVWEDGLMEAIGGVTISTFSNVSTGIVTGNISLYDEKDLKFLDEISTDTEFKKIIVANLKSDILKGKITKSEAEAKLQKMNEFSGIIQNMPDGLTSEQQIESINLIAEKKRLEKEIEGKDPSLVDAQKNRVSEINEQLKTISNNATKKTTEQQQGSQAEGGVSQYQGAGEGQQKDGNAEGGQREAKVNEADSGNSTIPSKVQEEVATYRAEEQAELLKAIPKIESYKVDGKLDKTLMPKTVLAKYNKIYNKYDKLISPLLEATTEIKIDKQSISTNTTEEVDRVKSLSIESEDGATFNLDGKKYDGPGLVVPVISMNTTIEDITPEMISKFVEEHADKIGDFGTVKVGIYKFPNSNQVSIDLNILAPESSRDQAIEFGKMSGQESLFDMSTFENVKTGATGENPMQFTPQQFKEIAKALKEGRMPNVFGTQEDTKNNSKESTAKSETNKADYKQNLVTAENSREVASRQKTPIRQRIAKTVSLVMRALPGVKIYLHNNEAEMHQALADSSGKSLEEVSKQIGNSAGSHISGEIHINMNTARENTLMHEAFHEAILRSGKSVKTIINFANGLKNIVLDKDVKAKLDDFVSMYNLDSNKIEDLEYIDEQIILENKRRIADGKLAMNAKESADYIDYITESTKSEEMLAELGSIMAEAETELTTTKLHQFLNLINRIAKSLRLPVILKSTATTQEAVDFINTMATSLRTGEEIVGDNEGDGKIRRQATEIMKGNESLEKFGLKKGKNITRKIGEALEARQRSKYGTIAQKDNSAEARKKISNWMVDEVKYFVEIMGDKSGKGWYGELYQKSLDRMSKIFPEMKTDQNARDLFTMLVAITSDGQKVMSNFKLAASAYDYYKKNGVMPTTLPGQRVASFEANLKRINELLIDYNGDVAAIKENLMEVKSIQEINKERKKEGLEALSTNWPVTFKAPFAASVFGPKLGMFFSNLSGNESYPTLDRWWSRTFNRYRGTLIPELKSGFTKKGEAIGLDRFKILLESPSMSNEEALLASKSYRDSYAAKGYKNGTEVEKAANTIYKNAFENLNDAPFTKNDRQFMYDTISDAVNKLNKQEYDLSIADVQAILWYFEKNLYKTLGVQAKIEGISYEDAANYTYDKWKEAGNKFNYEINQSEEGQSVEDEDIDDTEQPSKIKQQKTLQEELPLYKFGNEITTTIDQDKPISVLPLPERYMDGYEEATGKKLTQKDKQSFLYKLGRDHKYKKGGVYIDISNLENKDTVNGYVASSGEINIDPKTGRASLNISENISSPEESSIGKIIKTNLFKKKAGWNWTSDSDKSRYDKVETLVSVEIGSKHVYTLGFKSTTPIQLKNYSESKSEPRLRPTTKGQLFLGNYVGNITIRGKKHPVYDNVYSYDQNDYQTLDRLNYKYLKPEGLQSFYPEQRNATYKELKYNPSITLKDRLTDADQYIFDKLGIKNAEYVSGGVEASIYDIGAGKVIRISKNPSNFSNNLVNKKIEGVIPVYATGKVILPKRMFGLEDYTGQVIKTESREGGLKETEPLYYSILKKGDSLNVKEDLNAILNKLINYITKTLDKNIRFTDSIEDQLTILNEQELDEFKNNLDDKQLKDLNRIIEIKNNLKKIGVKERDSHTGNYVRNSNGDLEAVDLQYVRFDEGSEFKKTEEKNVIKLQKTPQETRMDNESESVFKKSLDRGTTWAKATQNALDYIQKSKWYQDANDIDREQKVRDFKQSKNQKLKKAPSVAKIMGTPKPNMVTVNEVVAFKDQLRKEAKAAREAKADLNSKRKSLGDAIKGMVKLGKLKATQAVTIIKRVSQVNLDNPVMVERLIDYASRVFERADYQERLDRAFSYRRAIRRLLKSDNQAQVIGMANQFTKIDPSMVENIDEYIAMADIVKNAVAPSRAKKFTLDKENYFDTDSAKGFDMVLRQAANIETVSNFVKDVLEKQEQKLKDELLATNNDLLESGVISADMTAKEIQEIVNAMKDPEYKMDSLEKEKYMKAYLSKRFESLASIITNIVYNPRNENPLTGEKMAIDEKDRAIILNLLKVDLSEMSNKDSIFIVEAMDNFITNGITSKLEGALSTYEGELGLKKEIKSGKVARALKLYFSPKIGRYSSVEFTPLPLMIERMFSGVTSGISVMKSMGLNIIINGVNKANNIHNKIINEYYDKFIKNSKTFHNPENVYERGMLSFLKRNVTGSLAEMKAETNRRINLITQSIDVLSNYGDESQKAMAEIYQKLFDKLGVSTGDIDIINARASKENREAVDWWINEWSKQYKDLADISLSVYNYDLGSDLNYTPDQFKTLKTESIDKNLLERNSSFLISMDKVTDKNKTGVLIESTRPTNMEKGRYVSLDFDSNNSNSLKGALVDINTAAGIRQVDGFLNSDLLNKLIPTAKDRDALKIRVNRYIRRAKGKITVPTDLYKDVDTVLNFAASLGVGKALGGVLQSVKQTIPIALSTAINTGKFNVAGVEFNQWLNKTGMPISNRGIESLSTIDSIDRRMEAKGTKIKDSLKWIAEKQQLYIKFFLSRPDVFIARSGFESYYLQYMGEKSIDWANHEPNQDALNYAQSMVDRQQNISDPMLGGEFLTSEESVKRIAKKVLFPFASFALNQKARLNSDLINLASKTTSEQDKKIAAKSAIATVAEMVAYRAMSAAIGYSFYKAAEMVINGFIGDDDDEDKDQDKKWWISASKFPIKSMITDLVSPVQMADQYVTMGTDFLLSLVTGDTKAELDESVKQENEIRALKDQDRMTPNQEEDFRQKVKDKSTFQVGSQYDLVNGFGMVSIASDLYKKIYYDYTLAMTGEFEDEYKGNITTKKIRPVEQDLMKNTLMFSALYAAGILPKESDQIVTKVVNMVKKNAMSESEYEKYSEFKTEFKREPSPFEMGMIKSEKKYQYISDDVNWVNTKGGLTLSQGREYVKIINTLGEVDNSTLLEIKAGKTADQIVKSMRAKL